MLGKRKSNRTVAPVKKRRKGEPPLEEIRFDSDAREEYLTGFHKRKLQRIKHAKEEALKKEREEKVAARKVLRETRKVDREKHVEAVNAAVADAEDPIQDNEPSDGQGEQWNGVEEAASIDHEDDYRDEDRHTVVTVEAVDVSRDGLQRRQDVSESEDKESIAQNLPEGALKGPSYERKLNRNKERTQPNLKSEPRPKKKKKKFRYESKADRKATRYKERMGSKAKAKARRE
ncbi:MAG: hypothetical protein LQ343_007137 [Gyalolechia ehrenbergii]|nr:MAG: hypothetical protein LQ343_007137 [Gyalolechia ehrenbergii]